MINHLYNFLLTSKLTNPYLRGRSLRRLDKEMDFFIDKILKGENFALVRNGDGERALMQGKSLSTQESWKSPSHITKLGSDLLDSLNVENPLFFYGISCPCCDKEAYYWYESRIKNPNKTFANLWVNVNFPRFKNSFEKIKKDAVLIANYSASGAKIGHLNILKHYKISDDCVSFWESEAEAMIVSIKRDFADSSDLLFAVSAGPISSPIIKNLFLWNPKNTYVDFGSAIDSYYVERQTRPYQDKHSIFGSRNCYMYEDLKCDVSVVLTLYKRGEYLREQVEALLNQSLKPSELILFCDMPVESSVESRGESVESSLESGSESSAESSQESKMDSIESHNIFDISTLDSAFDNIIKVRKNVGVWGRFSAGLLAKGEYICFFDDDTIPAHRWLENCHYESLRKDGLYGGVGILSSDLAKYPFDLAHRTIGWLDSPPFSVRNKRTKKVDFVGHSWFLKKDYLGVMWIGSNEFYKMRSVGEDAYLSFSLKKYLNISSFVPPQDKDEFLSSIKGLEYGKGAESIHKNDENLQKMNKALKLLKSKGMREVSLNLGWKCIYMGRKIALKFLKDEQYEAIKAKIKLKFKQF